MQDSDSGLHSSGGAFKNGTRELVYACGVPKLGAPQKSEIYRHDGNFGAPQASIVRRKAGSSWAVARLPLVAEGHLARWSGGPPRPPRRGISLQIRYDRIYAPPALRSGLLRARRREPLVGGLVSNTRGRPLLPGSGCLGALPPTEAGPDGIKSVSGLAFGPCGVRKLGLPDKQTLPDRPT